MLRGARAKRVSERGTFVATSTNPPPGEEGGGNAKYLVIGLLLLLGAVGIYFLMQGDGEVAQVPDAGRPLERSTALAEPMIELPDEVPDGGPVPDAGPPQKRIVYRYVRSDWDCSGDINAAAASEVIQSYSRQVRNCYERQLKSNHTLAGNMSLTLRIGTDGKVTGTHVGGSLRDPTVFACVRNLASSWTFAAPTGGSCAVVSQSFNFTPQQ